MRPVDVLDTAATDQRFISLAILVASPFALLVATDLEMFRARVAGFRADGGGDTPEAVNEAIHWTTRLDWNPHASARLAIVIGDAPPTLVIELVRGELAGEYLSPMLVN